MKSLARTNTTLTRLIAHAKLEGEAHKAEELQVALFAQIARAGF